MLREPTFDQDTIVRYEEGIEKAISEISLLLDAEYTLSKRSVALLLLQEDEGMLEWVKQKEKKNYPEIMKIIRKAKTAFPESLSFAVSMKRQERVNEIASGVVSKKQSRDVNITSYLSNLTTNPFTGIPILLLMLYFGLYKFVGEFGAGTLVDFIETEIFEVYINPKVNEFINAFIPWKILQDLIANEYGIITLGFRYAVAIVLPIVGAFFLVFSIIEDSGYLPRISLLLDRVFKYIGLNGRAVIPMTLGFGCDTMATMVSRTLETKRERIIATLLLALAIPCSAQLGVILSLLSSNPLAMMIWVLFMTSIFMLVGYLTAKLMPGERPDFYMEIPPLRVPKLRNILVKTYTRIFWYFKEILPLFVLASVLIWLGNITGLFELIICALTPVVRLIGLPDQLSEVFLFGFFRRDYGAAGLLDLQQTGLMTGRQLVVAAATLTLFVPCVAQFAMMVKERGVKTAVAMAAFIFPFAFGAGFVLNRILLALGMV